MLQKMATIAGQALTSDILRDRFSGTKNVKKSKIMKCVLLDILYEIYLIDSMKTHGKYVFNTHGSKRVN